MCFRPAEVSLKKCPECGKANKPIAKVCEACGAELDNAVKDFDADQAALDAAGTMATPRPPKASSVPGVPAPARPPVTPEVPKQP